MGTTFDELLASLHPNSEGVPQGATLVESDSPIKINTKRQFEVPEDYNLVLAYEGDVNSQKVTFKLPVFHENHNLSLCSLKTLRWRNTASNVEEWSNLEEIPGSSTTDGAGVQWFKLQWTVPPAAFASAGTIEIAISIYDTKIEGGVTKIAFSWNTPTFSGFTVAGTLSSVGEVPSLSLVTGPAKNEILFIHDETHSIVAPANYNFTICTFGSENTVNVFFQIPKKVSNINVADPNTEITVIVQLGSGMQDYKIANADITPSFADGSNGEGLVNFVWRVPPSVTANEQKYTGPFTIVVKIENGTSVWRTTPFQSLTIGQSIVNWYSETLPSGKANIVDGSGWDATLERNTVNAITQMRSYTEGEIAAKDESEDTSDDLKITKNEIIIIRNNDGTFKTLAIGNGGTDVNLAGAATLDNIVASCLANNTFIIRSELPETEEEEES